MLDAVPSFSSTRSAAIPFLSLRDACEIIASDGSMPAAKPRGASRAISARAAPGPNPISRTWSSGCTSRASTASAFMAPLPHSMILPAIHPNLPRGQSIHANLPRGHRNWGGGRAGIGSLPWIGLTLRLARAEHNPHAIAVLRDVLAPIVQRPAVDEHLHKALRAVRALAPVPQSRSLARYF